MKKVIKFGIFGLGRGSTFYNAVLTNNGEIVAVCDRDEQKLAEAAEKLGGDVGLYRDFDSFLQHPGLEAIFLCNNFHQHAEFAIKALDVGIHVLSECTSNATMADGVVTMLSAALAGIAGSRQIRAVAIIRTAKTLDRILVCSKCFMMFFLS